MSDERICIDLKTIQLSAYALDDIIHFAESENNPLNSNRENGKITSIEGTLEEWNSYLKSLEKRKEKWKNERQVHHRLSILHNIFKQKITEKTNDEKT